MCSSGKGTILVVSDDGSKFRRLGPLGLSSIVENACYPCVTDTRTRAFQAKNPGSGFRLLPNNGVSVE